MSAPTITITLGPWHAMVRELFAWALEQHPSKASAARQLGIPSTTVATWARQGSPVVLHEARARLRELELDLDALLGPLP